MLLYKLVLQMSVVIFNQNVIHGILCTYIYRDTKNQKPLYDIWAHEMNLKRLSKIYE